MEIFESSDSNNKSILIMEKKEAQLLVSMIENAAEQNKKKLTWKKMAELLTSKLSCF